MRMSFREITESAVRYKAQNKGPDTLSIRPFTHGLRKTANARLISG